MIIKILLGIGAGVTACIAVAVGGIIYLQSPSGSAFLLTEAKSQLAKKFDTRLEYTEGSFQLLKGFHFKNLKVTRKSPSQNLDFFAKALDCDFELSLFKKTLVVDLFSLDHAAIKVTTQEASTPPKKEEEKAASDLDHLFRNPPFQITVKKFSINAFTLNGDFNSLNHTEVRDLSFLGDMALTPGRARMKGNFSTDLSAHAKDLNVNLQASTLYEMDLFSEADHWNYEIKPTEFKFELKDTQFTGYKNDEVTTTHLPHMEGQTFFQMNLHSPTLSSTKGMTLDLLKLNSKMAINHMAMNSVKYGKKTDIFIDSQNISLHSDEADQMHLIFSATQNGMAMPEFLTRKINGLTSGKMELTKNLETVSIRFNQTLEKITVFTFDTTVKNLDHFTGKYQLIGDPKLASFVKSLAKLKETGLVQSTFNADGEISKEMNIKAKVTGAVPTLKLDPKQKPWVLSLFGDMLWTKKTGHLDWDGTLEATHPEQGRFTIKTKFAHDQDGSSSSSNEVSEEFKRFLPEPLRFSHQFDLSNVEFKMDAPRIKAPDGTVLENTKVAFQMHADKIGLPTKGEITASITQDRIVFDAAANAKKGMVGLTSLKGLDAHLKVRLINENSMVIDEMKATLNPPLVQFTAEGSGNLKTSDFQSAGTFVMEAPADFPTLQGQKISGRVEIPFTVTLERGQDVTFKGDINLINLAWAKGVNAFNGLSGRIPFEERLTYKNKEMGFTEVITQNPFERVNFERLRPLIQGADQLTIKTISWEEKNFGPFVGFFSIRQNILFAHQFDFDLGAGRISGELFFDTYPKNLQFGMLSRLTGLDLGEILPKRYLVKVPSGNKNISGRSGFVINLNKGTMDGRIDVTEIGSSQLITMINLLDPTYEDEKMNRIRGLLEIAYPTGVAIAFADGYMDMDIDLKALGFSPRESLRAVPISNFILNAKTKETAQP